MNILAFAASNSRHSINRMLVNYAASRLSANILTGVQIDTLDLNDFEMPVYSTDRENEGGIPARAQDFFARIVAADAILISFAEHNGSTTAAWKNIFDWLSRIDMKVFQGKPMILLAASPGPRAGAGVLDHQAGLLPHFGGNIVGQLGIGTWAAAWDADARVLTQEEDIAALDHVLTALKTAALKGE